MSHGSWVMDHDQQRWGESLKGKSEHKKKLSKQDPQEIQYYVISVTENFVSEFSFQIDWNFKSVYTICIHIDVIY